MLQFYSNQSDHYKDQEPTASPNVAPTQNNPQQPSQPTQPAQQNYAKAAFDFPPENSRELALVVCLSLRE